MEKSQLDNLETALRDAGIPIRLADDTVRAMDRGNTLITMKFSIPFDEFTERKEMEGRAIFLKSRLSSAHELLGYEGSIKSDTNRIKPFFFPASEPWGINTQQAINLLNGRSILKREWDSTLQKEYGHDWIRLTKEAHSYSIERKKFTFDNHDVGTLLRKYPLEVDAIELINAILALATGNLYPINSTNAPGSGKNVAYIAADPFNQKLAEYDVKGNRLNENLKTEPDNTQHPRPKRSL